MSDENERQYQRIVKKRLEQLVAGQIETNSLLEDIAALMREHMGKSPQTSANEFLDSSGTAIISAIDSVRDAVTGRVLS